MYAFKKLRENLKAVVLISISTVVLVAPIAFFCYYPPKPIIQPLELKSQVELIAVTPEGSKVYKIYDEKMIVPIILIQSANGSIAVR